MNTHEKYWQFLSAGLYTWIVTTFSGAILMDIVYSKVMSNSLEPSKTAAMFSEAANFLLFIGGVALLFGILTISRLWRSGSARNLFIASLFFVMVEFLAPILFLSLIQRVQVSLGFNLGMWIRLIACTLASVLAFVGLGRLYTSTS